MVGGDLLGRHGFRLYGHGEIRDGECCCCRHGNSNTLFCFEFDLFLFLKTTCFQTNVAECEFVDQIAVFQARFPLTCL